MNTASRLIFYLTFVLLGMYAIALLGVGSLASDFRIYTAAVHAAQQGTSAYYPYNIGASFIYHPVVLSLLSTITWLGDSTAFVLWTAAGIVCYALLLKHIARHWEIGWVLLLVVFAPFLEILLIGQINIFVTLAIVCTWQLAERRRDSLAGVALALAIVFKISPALLLVYFAACGRWRIIGATVVSISVLTLIPLLQFGAMPITEFVSVTLQTGGGTDVNSENLSLLTILTHLGVPLAGLIHKLLLVTLVALAVVLTRRGAKLEAFIILWLTLLALSPLVWLHHLVFIVGMIAILPSRQVRVLPILAALFLIQCERLNLVLPGIFSLIAVVLMFIAILPATNDSRTLSY